jgi:uncharacterized protein YigE (DUF2233 family)
MRYKSFFLFSLLISATVVIALKSDYKVRDSADNYILSYIVDAGTQDIQLYWKNDKNEIINTIQNLKKYVENKHSTLLFAMNGGMFKKDYSAQGLLIQNQKAYSPLDTSSGNGNFYLKPNGVFYISTGNLPAVCKTSDFTDNGKIKFATQSGPMLVIDGQIHPAFKEGSKNLNIRNGVGILPDKRILFALSKKEINFYDFAKYFQDMGCINALYLDGFVSRAYLPEKEWIQKTDGNFGVMIGVTKKQGN